MKRLANMTQEEFQNHCQNICRTVWSQTLHNFDVGPGWHGLIFLASCRLERFCRPGDPLYIKSIENYKGALRIEVGGRQGQGIDKVTKWAEIQSLHFCEICGNSGDITEHGKVRCIDHE